jgi:hypothetical protein
MSEAANAAPRPTRKRTRKRQRPQTRRDWFALVGKLTALIGLVSGVVTLVFLFFPGLKPVHVDQGTADISAINVQQPVTFRRFLQEMEEGTGSMSRQFLNRPGLLVSFHYQLDGFKGRNIPLRWELNDAATNDLVDQDQGVTIKPSTNSEGRDWYVWVPRPDKRRRYYITVTLYQPEKGLVPLKHFDTKPFKGGGRA